MIDKSEIPWVYSARRTDGNQNTGKPWSEMDDDDLKNCHALGQSVAETADYLMRTHKEVTERKRELGLLAKKRQGGANAR